MARSRLRTAMTPLHLGGPKQRAVLALLALNPNASVSVDRLIEGLWGERQPATAAKMVQLYVSQLRKLLAQDGGSEIVTRGRGYELRVDPESVDAARFERLVSKRRGRGSGAARPRTPRSRSGAGRRWRTSTSRSRTPRCGGSRSSTSPRVELAIEADLDAGRHTELIGRLDSLVEEHPLSERLHALRMLALYRAGRQADALEALPLRARCAGRARSASSPGPELRRLQEAILRQDPVLDLAVPGADWATRETAARVDEARRPGGRAARRAAGARVRAGGGRGGSARAAAPGGRHPAPSTASRSVRSRGSPPSTSPTPTTSSGASGSWRRSSRGSWGPPARASSGRPAAASRRPCAPACSPPSRRRAPGQRELARRSCSARASTRLRDLRARARQPRSPEGGSCSRSTSSRSCSPPRDEEQRRAYMDALVDAAQRDDGRVVVVLAVRADYYGACAAHPRLARLLGGEPRARRPDAAPRSLRVRSRSPRARRASWSSPGW